MKENLQKTKTKKILIYSALVVIALIVTWLSIDRSEATKYNECVEHGVKSNPNLIQYNNIYRNCVRSYVSEDFSISRLCHKVIDKFSSSKTIPKLQYSECLQQIEATSDVVKSDYMDVVSYCHKEAFGKNHLIDRPEFIELVKKEYLKKKLKESKAQEKR